MPPWRNSTLGKSKVETFIGFSVKSRKIVFGSGAIDVQKRDVYLIMVSGDAAKNTQALAIKFKNRYSCPLVKCIAEFERIVNRPGCKIAAFKDRRLASAILENLDDNYELYVGGDGQAWQKNTKI